MTDQQEKSRAAPTSIHAQRGADRQFLFHPADNDVFVRTGRQIIDACRLTISVEVWLDELEEMMKFVRTWCADNRTVRGCICSPRAARVMLFFVPTSTTFNFDLADQLTDLDIHISREFHLGSDEVSEVPLGQADRFLIPEESIEIYGQHDRPSEPVGTQS